MQSSEYRVQPDSKIVKSHRDLIAWQKAMNLVNAVYLQSDKFPQKEIYSLTSQVRRASISVPSNIAEGSSKESTLEFVRFLNIAYGSLCEIETQIEIALNLGYINQEDFKNIINQSSEVGKIINGLKKSLKTKLNSEL